MATVDEIMQVFGMLKANYHREFRDKSAQEVSDLQILWCELLGDIPGDVLKATALQHVSESKWFPAVAELRDGAARIMQPRRTTAVEAWGEVVRQIRAVGYYGIPQFSDPITAQVVGDLGWRNLCVSEGQINQASDRSRFIEGWQAAVKRERSETVMLPEVRRVIARVASGKRIEALPCGVRK